MVFSNVLHTSLILFNSTTWCRRVSPCPGISPCSRISPPKCPCETDKPMGLSSGFYGTSKYSDFLRSNIQHCERPTQILCHFNKMYRRSLNFFYMRAEKHAFAMTCTIFGCVGRESGKNPKTSSKCTRPR